MALCRAGNSGIRKICNYIPSGKTVADGYCHAQALLREALTGFLQHNSYTFGGLYYGHYFLSAFKTPSYRFDPVLQTAYPDVTSAGTYPLSLGTDMIDLPAGVHLVAAYNSNEILINKPVDPVLAANGIPSVYDIHPDRGDKVQTGPNTFIIGGENFHNIQGAWLAALVPVSLFQPR